MERTRVVLMDEFTEFAQRYIEMKRTGSALKGVCVWCKVIPPTFFLSPKRGLFYCTSCGRQGNYGVFRSMVEAEVRGANSMELVQRVAEFAQQVFGPPRREQ